MSNKIKIARVIPISTLSSSGLAGFKGSINPLKKRYLKIIENIALKYHNTWIKPYQILFSAYGFVWLFVRLPLKLIKSRYHLFIAVVRDPQGFITFLISKLLRKPIIMADTFYTWDDRLVFRVYWPMARLAASKATLLVVPSQKVRRFWRLSGLPENKIRVTRLFVSILNIDKACLKEAKEIEEKLGFRKKVLFVGRLVPGKGVEYLLKAFARASAEIDGAGLIIIGDGPQRTRLEKLSIDMKLSNVIFLGFVSRDKIAPYYLVSDILVLPSFKTRTHEEWGLVVNEAMSVGKPVIVTESVGCSYELVKNYVNGLIVPDKNTVALYKAIKMLLTDDELRYKMGKEAKKTIINGFTYKQEVDDYLQIIKDALNRNCKIKK